ncbi:MAG: siderophore-iron reductase FhuF [Pollutimonas bauzanensis]|uniref:Ferric iron reductase protein FhuF n=1 Tax=Pollutimonas bauzanensis TaxID=658167 RepID=A0A1M5S8E3_9BURK|nr:siderophore-iron reductase FhuF [Pollutimonas bauzanensis]SHH34912.1 ferric iron reductase protein FhuF [Pollutimonas bauzanensis]
MIAALAPLFVGDFTHYRDALVLRDDARPSIPLRDLQKHEGFERVLREYGVDYPDGDRRALASEWSKLYFIRLLPPVLAAAIMLDRRLSLDVDRIEIVLGARAEPLAFKLPDAGDVCVPTLGDPFAAFVPLLDHHLEPMINAWARHSKLSPRVFWSNAGNYFEWLVNALTARASADQVAPARAILASPHRPDGRPNRLFRPLRYIDQDVNTPWRQRRVCCVRYLLPGMALCANCPLCKHAPAPGIVPRA